MLEDLTVPQKLLLAAISITKKAQTFGAEDLVVEAWRLYPDTFGLTGYSKLYPDSNRVLTNIMGDKGLRGKGWIRKVGEKQYRLTSVALLEGESLLKNRSGSQEAGGYLRAELERRTAVALERLVSTLAARKILGHVDGEPTFNDACGLWDISPRSNASTLSTRLADVSAILERARDAVGSRGEPGGLRLGSVDLTETDVDALIKAHQDLQVRYNSELDVIRKRTDERLGRKRSLP